MDNSLASREGAVLLSSAEDTVSAHDEGDGYTYLPWVDLICAGVPCQDVSVAGKRAGLKGERTGLFFQFARILRELRPTWFVFENVPGLLSSNGGRDFAEVLRVLMVECGYGVSWRVLDSQFFRVAQQRRRLFIVGRFGKPCPAEILFERETGSIVSPAGRAAGVRDAANAGNCFKKRGGFGWSEYCGVSGTLENEGGSHTGGMERVPLALCFEPRYYTRDNKTGGAPRELAHPLRTEDHSGDSTAIVCFESRYVRNGRGAPSATVPPLKSENGGTGKGDGAPLVCAPVHPDGVRSLAELPEGMDSSRYKALGNAVTVTVARWIAERIKEVAEQC